MVSPGSPRKGTLVAVPAGGYRQNLTLESRTITRVRVVTDDEQAPACGSIWANDAGLYQRWYRRTICIDGLPAGHNTISVRESAHQPVSIEVEVTTDRIAEAPGLSPRRTTLRYPHEGPGIPTIRIEREVVLRVLTRSRGRPVPDVAVCLLRAESDHPVATMRTDSTGRAEFTELRPGPYRYRAMGVVTRVERITVDTMTELEIEVVKGVSVTGTVEEADGTPCEDLQVAVNPDPRDPPPDFFFHAKPALVKEGRFQLDGLHPNGTVILHVLLPWSESTTWVPLHRVDGVVPGTEGLRIVPGARRPIRVQARKEGTLSSDKLLVRVITCTDTLSAGYTKRESYRLNVRGSAFVGAYDFLATVGTT